MDNCHHHASCRNINGSFSCSCNSGHTGNGTDCHGMSRAVKRNSAGVYFCHPTAHELQNGVRLMTNWHFTKL